MAYEFEYSMGVPEKRGGSGYIKHACTAEGRVVGDETWTVLRSGDSTLPAQEIIDALASGTVGARGAAYKALLAKYVGNVEENPVGWGTDILAIKMDNMALETQAEAAITDYVMNDLPVAMRKFPVRFTM